MSIFLQLVSEGLLLGTFYAFMSLGFFLTWGVLNIINLAYGTYVVIGSYIAYSVYRTFGLDPALSIPLSFMCGAAFGIISQKFLINRIMFREPFMVLIITFGFDIMLSHFLNLIFKADVRSIDVWYAEKSLVIGNFVFSVVKIAIAVISGILIAALYIWLRRSWTGKAIRAVALDIEGARLVGINPYRIFLITSGIGTGIAFSAGNLYGVIQGFTPFDGGFLTIKAFLISILGGLGRIENVLVGGVLIGIFEVFTGFYIGETWKLFAALFLMLIILSLRPRGLFGGKYYGQI